MRALWAWAFIDQACLWKLWYRYDAVFFTEIAMRQRTIESGLSPPMQQAIPIIRRVFKQYAPRHLELELTAGKEWYNHSRWSLHHSGNAIDIRTRKLADRGTGILSILLGHFLQQELNSELGKAKYLVLVNDQGPMFPHIHIQYNPGARMSTPGDYDGKRQSKTV